MEDKMLWAGHVARLADNRWTSFITKWYSRERKGHSTGLQRSFVLTKWWSQGGDKRLMVERFGIELGMWLRLVNIEIAQASTFELS